MCVCVYLCKNFSIPFFSHKSAIYEYAYLSCATFTYEQNLRSNSFFNKNEQKIFEKEAFLDFTKKHLEKKFAHITG